MTDGIDLILPGDMDDDLRKKLERGEQITPQDQAKARDAMVAAEMNALKEESEYINNLDALPFKDDAPLCALMNGPAGTPRVTKFHEVVQMPAWAHGRCIGALCHRWRQTKVGGICGDVLPHLAAGFQLGVIDETEIAKEFERWASDDEEAEEKKLVKPA